MDNNKIKGFVSEFLKDIFEYHNEINSFSMTIIGKEPEGFSVRAKISNFIDTLSEEDIELLIRTTYLKMLDYKDKTRDTERVDIKIKLFEDLVEKTIKMRISDNGTLVNLVEASPIKLKPPPPLEKPIERLKCEDPELLKFLNERGKYLKYKNVEYFKFGQTSCIFSVQNEFNNMLILKIYHPDQLIIRAELILKKIDHPNIIKVEKNGTFETKFKGVNLEYSILEFFDGTPLNDGREYLSHHPFQYRLECALQLIIALQELNNFYTNHGDLHEGNVLLSLDPKNDVYLKVIDPGMSSRVQNTRNDIDDFKGFCFTYFFTNSSENDRYKLNKIDKFQHLYEISEFLNKLKTENQLLPDMNIISSSIVQKLETDLADVYEYAMRNKEKKLPSMGMPFYKAHFDNYPNLFNKLGIEVVSTGRNDIFKLRFFRTYLLDFGSGARLYNEKTNKGLKSKEEYNEVLERIKNKAKEL